VSAPEAAPLSERLRLTPEGVDGVRRDAQDLHQHPDPLVRNLVDDVLHLLHDYRLVRAEVDAAERQRDRLQGRLEQLARRLRAHEAVPPAALDQE
jgi:transcription elongation GreA/GreB family factor